MQYRVQKRSMEEEFNAHKNLFRKFKLIVRRSHWRKNLSSDEREILSQSPVRLMMRLNRLENFLDLYKLKLEYYSLIVENEGRPDVEYQVLRNKIARKVRGTH